MKIDIYSDTICPWCFIGKRRLERALAERPQPELELTWRPFQLNPEMPPGGMERQRYLELKFGGPAGAKQVYDNVRQTGRSEGIDFAFERLERTPNTLDSHRLVRLAGEAGRQDAVVQALFHAYFLEARDIGDVDVLVAAAEAGGLDPAQARAYLESDRDAEAVRAEDARARQIGIQGVPTYILADKYVLSGAHPPEVLFHMFELGHQEDAAEAETPAEG
jgi:predicted DsbA family dithiol-disulfide isomerase